MVSDAAIMFFAHRKFKDEIALDYEFYKSFNTWFVTINEFFISILCPSCGVTNFCLHKNGAFVFFN